MINSYLHEIPLKTVKKTIKRQDLCTETKLGKNIKNNFINTHKEWIFWMQKAVVQTSKTNVHLTVTWLQAAVKNFLSSRQIIMNCRRLWNSHQGTSSWGPWHLATFWNLESRKWHFQGFSRGILHHRGCHVVSSECAQDWEQCRRKDCRNVPGASFERFTDLNQFKYAFNVNQNWETDERGFAWHRILPNSQFQKRE